jgi:hypothetical protein
MGRLQVEWICNLCLPPELVALSTPHGILYLIKQRPHLGRVSYFFLSERLSHDHAAGGVNSEMQFAPASACARAVLFLQPFASAVHFQSRAVDQYVQGPIRYSPERD